MTIWDQCVIISKVPSSVSGCCKRARAPRSPLPTWSSTLATTEIELKLSHLEHLDHEAPVEIELHVQVQTQVNQVPASDRKLCRECLTTSLLAPWCPNPSVANRLENFPCILSSHCMKSAGLWWCSLCWKLDSFCRYSSPTSRCQSGWLAFSKPINVGEEWGSEPCLQNDNFFQAAEISTVAWIDGCTRDICVPTPGNVFCAMHPVRLHCLWGQLFSNVVSFSLAMCHPCKTVTTYDVSLTNSAWQHILSPGTSWQGALCYCSKRMVFTKLYWVNRTAPRVTNSFVQCTKECFVQIAKEETSLCANRSASCVAATLRVVAPSGHCPAPTLIHSL